MKILITGMGVISSIGNNLEENFYSLSHSIGGISEIEGIEKMRKPFLGGQVKKTNTQFRQLLNIPMEEKVHRSTLLGLTAALEAWGESKHDERLRTGLIFGTTVGGVDLSAELIEQNPHPTKGGALERIDFRKTHHRGFGTDFIANRLGISDYKTTLSTACSTAANSILLGARLIKAGLLDRVLAGGAEALSNYTLNGFDALMLYDPGKCKPFDENRKGLNLGEAGGFMMIENEKSAEIGKREKLAELLGWSNTCDSYHITASSPNGIGASLAMSQALEMAGVSPDSVDYINAHGTGTPNNDLSESNAMKNVFGENVPPFSSTKSFTGHTLAAAGGIEAIFSVLSLRHQMIFPNLNYSDPMKEISFSPVKETITNRKIKTVISNSFGFGGNCTELVFTA